MKNKKEKKQKSLLRNIIEWVATILAALLIALVIRSFVFELVRVDGHSMDNTLADGEIMLVTKYDYSSTWLCLPWQDSAAKESAARFTFGGNPERFDIVICRYPGRGDTNFVKRVVGLPGETIRFRGGRLSVDGQPVAEDYLSSSTDDCAIDLGDGEYIHAADVGIGVVVSPMDEIRTKYVIRRVFADEGQE